MKSDSVDFNVDGSAIGVILYTEQFYVNRTTGDSSITPDGKGGCCVAWGKYPDLSMAFLGVQYGANGVLC